MPLSLDGTTGISASGNITAAYLFGNASGLSGISSNKIFNGTSEANIGTSGGNANVSIGGTSNVAIFASTGLFVTGVTSTSGNVTGGNLLTAGLISATGNITGGNVLGGANVNATTHTGTTVSVTGNIDGGNLLTAGLISATGNITGGNVLGGANVNATTHTGTTVSVTGNIDGGNLRTAGLISATGNITGGNIAATNHTGTTVSVTGAITGGAITGSSLTVSTGSVTLGSIINANANGVGNIGNSTGYFNTIFAKATSAQYADVAEKYVADRPYAPGTILEIGGAAEVQETTAYASTRIAGVVSTTPALLMNSGETDANSVEIALLGRVPCRVTGTIHRGDLLTSSDRPGVATALRAADYRPGCVIGKALEAHATAGDGIIEVLVGRL